MKETIFYLNLHLKTPEGFERFGKFYIGNEAVFARNLFNKLKGTPNVDNSTMLFIELMETRGGLPFNIQVIACTLDELAINCTLITKETFKLHNLDELRTLS